MEMASIGTNFAPIGFPEGGYDYAPRESDVRRSEKKQKSKEPSRSLAGKAESWVDEYVKGNGEERSGDFMKTVAAGSAVGASVGTFIGLAKGVYHINNAEPVKTESTHEIMEDKLKGYDQHAEPFGSDKWSLTFKPTIAHEKVGEYTTTEYTPPSVSGILTSGAVGLFAGAVGGGLITAVVKVIRDYVLSRE